MTTPFGLLPSGPVPDPGLEHATDHADRAVGVLLSQLRDKPRFTTLVRILAEPFQELEDVFWDLYTKRRIDTAVGAQLDLIGKIVVEPRGGLGDEDYRAIIRIKVRVLFSRGTGPDLIRIALLFLVGTPFTYDEFYPAGVMFNILDVIDDSRAALLKRFLRKAKMGGVKLDVIRPGPSGNMALYASDLSGGGAGGYASDLGAGGGNYGGVI